MLNDLQTNKCLKVFLLVIIVMLLGTTTVTAQSGNAQHAFSVSASQQVYFSPGNLQYRASTNTWRFAINPWDYVGGANHNISSIYDGWIDLFGWGTSGYNHGAICYQPWSTSTSYSDYYAYGKSYYNLYDQTGQADWGYNAISNGGNLENSGWRTLTKDEWVYVFYNRNTTSGIRYAKANVNNINGMILLPDDWQSSYYTLNNINSGSASYTTNTITATQWVTLEYFGAVFLPAAGHRYGTNCSNVGTYGNYYSSSYRNSSSTYSMYFTSSDIGTAHSDIHSYGRSVRLVRPAQTAFSINATPNPAEGGTVSGAGDYSGGAECTLTATPSAGYDFACWLEEGCVVSLETDFTFTVLYDRNLVAVFVAEGNITFANTNVKAICVEHWDLNGDGELSYGEAAKVTELGTEFKGSTTINAFNELQHFISLNSIGTQAFYGCTALTQVTIPERVTISIGTQAFYGCTELTQVTIPERVTMIGGQAFWNCPALQTINFNAVNCISMQTTYNNDVYSVFSSNGSGSTPALTRVVIGDGVQRIPDYAFKNSSNIYPGLVIRSSVTAIGAHAFENCSSFTTLTFQSGSVLTSIGDYAFSGCVAWNKPLNLPNSLLVIGAYAFNGCSSLTGNLVIPNTVTAIGQYAFNGCSGFNGILSLPANDFYTTVNECTFNGCSGLNGTLTIPENVVSIGNSAFRDCSSFTGTLILYDSVTTIGGYGFYGCSSLSEVTIGEGVTDIGGYAFYGCSNLSELTIGEDVTNIGGYAFWDCPNLITVNFNATNCTTMVTNSQYSVFNSGASNGGTTPIVNLTIGDHVTRIPAFAFIYSSNATCDLILPNGLTYIGSSAFNSCGFSGDLIIPDAVTVLGGSAFYGCSGFNGSLVIGSGVQTIYNNTFDGCAGFVGSLIVGRQVNSIGNNAFHNCNGFTVLITENPDPIAAQNNSFSGMYYDIPVYVPNGLVSNYQSATGWNVFTNYVEQYVFWEVDDDNWSNEMNWLTMELPSENDVVCITNNCNVDTDVNVLHVYVLNLNDVLTINSGKTLSTNYGIGILQPSQLIMEEGCQLVNNLPGLYGTMKRQIPGYGSGNGGWFTVSAPIYRGASVSPLTTGSYDLYAYDEPTAMWLNQKDEETALESFIPGHGYLYAHQNGFEMQLAGQLNASNADISVPVTCQNGFLPGFNLLGNPYTNNININSVRFNNTPIISYYKAVGGSQLVAYTDADNDAIQPIEGFFVQVPHDGMVYFNSPSRQEKGSYVCLALSKDDKMLDRAYLRMNEGATLNKAFVEGHPSLLYLTENNQSYAVAPHGSQAYNLCFEPVERGTFTLERELLDAECQYLHLIDKFTGDDIDLLRISQYSFEADTTDGFNRFALVLSPDDMPEEEPYPMRSTNAVPKLPSHGGTSGHIAYQQGQIYITAMANPAEGGKVNGKTVFTNVYNNGQTVTLAATANAHYTFTNWTKNGAVVSTNATYSFTVTGNASYTANFSAVPQYTVTISQSPANGGTISFGGKDNGEELLYDFDDNTMQGWTTLKGSSGNSPHNWMHCSSYTYSNYTGKGHNNSQGFVLSESYISGSTSGTGSAVYPDNYLVSPQVKLGGSIRFWATNPNDEYGAEHFGVAVSTDGNTDVNDFTIIREWTLSPISKASKTGNMRNITNGTWYEYTADLSAFSGMGYVAIRHFDCSDQWLLCIDDITIVEGEVKRQVYYWGENCTVTAAPNTNCQFVNWTEDGEPVSTNATYNFIVTADRTLVANYNQGILSGLFSVSDNSQVSFSQGNLQYQASTNTWQFAEHQYDYVGESNSNISQTYSGWIDLFGWGTSGYNHGAIAYQPWSTSYDNSDYYAYGSYAYNLFDQSGQADWGFNAISNGGNQENRGWRTLTKEEWLYVFNNRSTTSGIRYTKAIVNNVNGVILLPDNWIADYYTLNNINQSGADFGGNIITSVQWDMLEQHGAVFLPAAGYRYGTSVGNVGSHGSYWSASYSISYFPWYFYFYDSYLYTNSYSNYDVRHQGLSVRLVRSFQNCFFGISATPNPTEGGAVSGAGTYQPGDICTLTATPSAGYTFVNWTENGSVVSSNPTYTFTVTGDRNLVANFNQNGSGITQITALTNGWNWWSSYIELNGIEGLALLENSMGDNGVMVKSRDEGFVEQYDNNGSPLWYGPLSSIHNEQMYMIRTNADCAASLTGQLASPANHPVTINPGWNWIGYPNPQGVSVATAMSGFTPAANDVIKGRFNYTTYYNENGSSLWYGTLNSLEPGQGYMYQSKGNSVKTLTFNTGRGEDAPSNVTTTGNVFQPQSSGYANTMTVTAVVDVDGEELRSERYELAAFCGDECRGSVKLMWIAPLNRYVAFLTVFGDTGDGITFRLTDGAGMATAAERCAFTADGALGTLTQPFTLRFGTLGVGEDNVASVMVFPNPVEKGQPFRVDLPESFGNATVEVVDVMGRVIGVYVCAGRDDVHIVSTTAAPTIPAPTVPGVYTVRITGEQGQTQYGKIIVK